MIDQSLYLVDYSVSNFSCSAQIEVSWTGLWLWDLLLSQATRVTHVVLYLYGYDFRACFDITIM